MKPFYEGIPDINIVDNGNPSRHFITESMELCAYREQERLHAFPTSSVVTAVDNPFVLQDIYNLESKLGPMANDLKRYLSDAALMLPSQRSAVEAAQEILGLHESSAGSTFNLYFGNQAGQRLYSVSIYPERSLIVPGRQVTVEILQAFIEANGDLLLDPRCCVGTWYDPDADETYVDVSVTLSKKRDVVTLGKRYNQVGVFDLLRMKYIPTGGSGQMADDAQPERERLPALFGGKT